MKGIFFIALLVAVFAMVMAATHHYKVQEQPEYYEEDSSSGTIFNRFASGLDDAASGIAGFFG